MDEQARADYVERWSRLLEDQGTSRIAGRIYGHLATSGEPHLSLNDLAEQLGVSRGSVSTNTRRLVELGLVARVLVPGSRREHFTADPGAARGMVERAAVLGRAVEQLAREGVELQAGSDAPGVQSLRVIADLYGRLAETLEDLGANR
jgi:DNA-binding MarR family transcriptional regulator